MKHSLQLKIGQQLTMTPQLQQAIRLLQLSSLDLQQEIYQALYTNPLLELAEESENESAENVEIPEGASAEAIDNEPVSALDLDRDTQNELPVDTSWDESYQPAIPTYSGNQESGRDDQTQLYTATQTLDDHLLWQLNLTPFSELDRAIAQAIIDAIGPNGMLVQDLDEIYQALAISDLEMDEIVAVLHRVQQFDPPGVGARDLQECLLIQLGQFAPDTPYLKEARQLVCDHLPLIAERDYRKIAREGRMDKDAISEAVRLIQSLSPYPGDTINLEDAEYIVPDVRVRKNEDRWLVTLNGDITPRLMINNQYAGLVRRADNSSDNQFLRNNLQEARWFLRSLESRNDTLLRVSMCIVELQREFLERGAEAMRPLILADVAERLELHESTISRVTTQKYIDTPQGIFELKYFFSSHVSTVSGGECSSIAIRAMLKKIITEEDPAKPFSDNKLALHLETQGIQVARRTVAKYRESIGIATASERKRFKHRDRV